MKRIEVEDDLYAYIASHTQQIGESASDILRRLLGFDSVAQVEPVQVEERATDSVFNRLNQQDVNVQKSVVARFLYILSMLYKTHPEQFETVLTIRGRDRQYFARSEEALLTSGNSTNPKAIPSSPFWVVTNNNTTKKKSMLTQVAQKLGYSKPEVEQIRDFL
ncbi:replication initiation negative regulator SeqA [Idiomarina baltica]|jgi:negative modulator of initiation of replication|uniref:Negative modulator of initiation of replication n=1 Tax=Idiomarina baltica OS145 TaxID=314276 RepID=A0ABM9WNI3_9GAMM|nr:replication initiation negative regulator SeqA [Idiomarina baltica]MAF75084.1 replication initiation negative regulator SeqA [Idiomarinaceae bacterium]MBR37641.1 replication initiation negative regulator SeqA [Idiomarina sp.]MEC8925136.1 replication initiation negative regulator SeqA [Pseudomonadota bacterium]EAQ32524.1 Negative regulator of replication initiation [Idiomarina baltica OS145]MBL73364.1 replication initiation negative regulator SeqA [Idiomarinaceae bacterium]|tara:strand:- start:221 stop:709 length:489 start_codon:yes stop_codon:yes gene_type:complete